MRFFKNKALISTIIIAVLMLILISVSSAGNAVSSAGSAVGSVLMPVQEALYQTGLAFAGEASPSPSSGTALDYEELVAENERLRAMLEYKETNVNQELKVAQIIGKEPGNWFEVFTINLGASDGIAKNMPVITPQGLVGRVEEVGVRWAKVMSIMDARSSVSAIMERTRDTGIVKGTVGSDDLTASLTMNYLPLDTDIIEGDTVLTSGYDEVYPKGLVVGTVSSSKDQSGGKQVQVEPSVDFRRLEEVMVIVSSQETEEQGVVASITDAPLQAPSVSTNAPDESGVEPLETSSPTDSAEGYTPQPSATDPT